MQTFIVDVDYHVSHRKLDAKRLGNQIYREALTLARGGWPNHPASKMWAGHVHELCKYSLAGLDVLDERGKHYPHHRDTFTQIMTESDNTGKPWWMLDERLFFDIIRTHRSNLIRKAANHYQPFWPDLDGSLEYIWPSRIRSN